MSKIDTLSPALFAGLLGYAATGAGVGFWVGAVVVWFGLTMLVVIAAGLARNERNAREREARTTIEFAE